MSKISADHLSRVAYANSEQFLKAASPHAAPSAFFSALPLAAWFSFASAAQAADFSPPRHVDKCRGPRNAAFRRQLQFIVSHRNGHKCREEPGDQRLTGGDRISAASPSTGTQTSPLTPQEWAQRNFPEVATNLQPRREPSQTNCRQARRTSSPTWRRGCCRLKSSLRSSEPRRTPIQTSLPAMACPAAPVKPLNSRANTTAPPSPSTSAATNATGNAESTNGLKAAFITSMDALDDKHRLA